MPLYDIKCEKHGKQEILSSVTSHFACPSCDRPAHRVFSIGRVKIKEDFIPGWDMGAGRNFYSARERNNFLAEKGWTRIRD